MTAIASVLAFACGSALGVIWMRARHLRGLADLQRVILQRDREFLRGYAIGRGSALHSPPTVEEIGRLLEVAGEENPRTLVLTSTPRVGEPGGQIGGAEGRFP